MLFSRDEYIIANHKFEKTEKKVKISIQIKSLPGLGGFSSISSRFSVKSDTSGISNPSEIINDQNQLGLQVNSASSASMLQNKGL